jgi:hypothetical protein
MEPHDQDISAARLSAAAHKDRHRATDQPIQVFWVRRLTFGNRKVNVWRSRSSEVCGLDVRLDP